MVIPVLLKDKPYSIHIEQGGLHRAGACLKLDRRVLVVTDDGVPAAYAAAVADACKQARVVTLPTGEKSKSFAGYQQLLRAMLATDMGRGDCVVAVGGGMVGDLAGFAAATYMRGIAFYNVPTTLLSQVDSSIGGKTAIDMDGVKNIVGAFHQPEAVLIDPDVLMTLPQRQISAGLAESVKMAMTCDAALLTFLERCGDLTEALPEIIARSLAIKKKIVEEDPQEKGLRRVLNFGHTVGHAIESSYGGALLHGECVALGMLPMCAPALRPRLERLLKRCGLSTEVKAAPETLLPWLRHDKKSQSGGVTVVRVEEAGTFRFETMTPEEILHCMEGVLL